MKRQASFRSIENHNKKSKMNEEDQEISNTLFVGNLSPYLDEYDLIHLFERIGKCKCCKIIHSTENDPLHFIIEFEKNSDVISAVKDLNGRWYLGKNMIVVTSLDELKKQLDQSKLSAQNKVKSSNQFKIYDSNEKNIVDKINDSYSLFLTNKSQEDQEIPNVIYVGDIRKCPALFYLYQMDQNPLLDLFNEHIGKCKSSRIVFKTEDNPPYAIIEFEESNDVISAVKVLNGKRFWLIRQNGKMNFTEDGNHQYAHVDLIIETTLSKLKIKLDQSGSNSEIKSTNQHEVGEENQSNKMILYVSNLSRYVTESNLLRIWRHKDMDHAKCTRCQIIQEPGKERYAFVEFQDVNDAEKTLRYIKGISLDPDFDNMLDDKELIIKWATDFILPTQHFVQALFKFSKMNSNDQNKFIQKFSNDFRESFKQFDDNLAKLEVFLKRPIDYIYDEFMELKRLIQLDTEETIARIKQSNDIDINTNESQLEPDLLLKINAINKQSEKMINETEEIHKDILKTYASNKQEAIVKDFNELKEFSIKYKQVDEEKVQESTGHLKKKLNITKDLINKINSKYVLIKTCKKNESTQKNDELSIYLKQSFNLDMSTPTFLKDILNRSYCLEIFNNKFLLVHNETQTSATKCLTLFNPKSNKAEKKLIINDIYSFKSMHTNKKDLIAIQYTSKTDDVNYYDGGNCEFYDRKAMILLIDTNLEIIKKIESPGDLNGADEYNLYFFNLINNEFNISIYDWSLNKINGIKIQSSNESVAFYMPKSTATVLNMTEREKIVEKKKKKITQIESRDGKYFFKHEKYLFIYDLNGKLIKFIDESTSDLKPQEEFHFRFNSKNNLIVVGDKVVSSLDLNGNLMKQIYLVQTSDIFKSYIEKLMYGKNNTYCFILDEKDNPKFYNVKYFISGDETKSIDSCSSSSDQDQSGFDITSDEYENYYNTTDSSF